MILGTILAVKEESNIADDELCSDGVDMNESNYVKRVKTINYSKSFSIKNGGCFT